MANTFPIDVSGLLFALKSLPTAAKPGPHVRREKTNTATNFHVDDLMLQHGRAPNVIEPVFATFERVDEPSPRWRFTGRIASDAHDGDEEPDLDAAAKALRAPLGERCLSVAVSAWNGDVLDVVIEFE